MFQDIILKADISNYTLWLPEGPPVCVCARVRERKLIGVDRLYCSCRCHLFAKVVALATVSALFTEPDQSAYFLVSKRRGGGLITASLIKELVSLETERVFCHEI